MWRVLVIHFLLVGCKADPSTTDPTGPGSVEVVINELVSSNATGLQDASGAYPDWIELKNLGDEEADLSAFTLTDDAALPQKWSFPTGTTIPPGGFLIVFADGDPTTTEELHTSFRLSQLGEEVLLIGPAADDLPVLDDIVFPELATDASFARSPDGTGAFATDPTPTPGAANE